MTRLWAVLFAIAAVIALGGCSDLRDSEDAIVVRLTAETPVGSTKEEVRRVAAEAGRLPVQEETNTARVALKEPFSATEWHSLLRVHLGEYETPVLGIVKTDVVAFYVFNADEELVEIAVVKQNDSL